MNAERLLAHYERIADAPDAIARLRRFILDLAVRGKLVPQDANDEPASELLKRIVKEKARLAKAGEIKDKPLPPVDGDADFEVPPTWRWTRLGTVTSYIQRGKSPKYAVSDGSLVVSQKCVQWSGLDLTVAKQVTLKSLGDYEDIRFLRDGDLLWNSTGTGTIGRIIRLVDPPEKLVCDSHVTVVRCLEVEPEYIRTWLRSDHVYALIEDRAAGSTNQVELTAQIAINQVVPLPPLAEQHRIVAKVDELMGLCDRLEAARAGREAVRDRLAAASLARLNAPDPETFQADARFALDALPALTTRPDQIKRLRQTILNLAVRGKLVPQDPKDEPASELLKRLHRERKNKTKFAQIDEDELESPLPDLPSQWLWTTTDQISADDDNAITDGPFGSQLKTDHYIDAPGFRVIRLQNIGSGSFRDEHRSYVDQSRYERLSKHHVKAGDLVVAGLVDPSVRCCEVPTDIGPALVKADCYRFAVHPRLSTRYALHCLNSPLTQGFAAVHHHGMTLTRIGLGNFRRIPFPLPPLAEQHRIVAKVDALMALCDQLEASLTATAATRRRLLDALLAEALAPQGARELEAAE